MRRRYAWFIVGLVVGMIVDSALWLTFMQRHPEKYP